MEENSVVPLRERVPSMVRAKHVAAAPFPALATLIMASLLRGCLQNLVDSRSTVPCVLPMTRLGVLALVEKLALVMHVVSLCLLTLRRHLVPNCFP